VAPNKYIVCLFLPLVACGEDTPLHGSLRTCAADAACPIGELCDDTLFRCVAVDPSAAAPRPQSSTDLIERLGALVFTTPAEPTGDEGVVTIDMTVLDATKLTLSQNVRAGTVRAKGSNGQIRLWSLRVGSDGGGVSVMSVMSGPSGPTGGAEAYVANIVLESSGDGVADLVADAYPKAHFSVPMPMTLKADVGGSKDDLHPIELAFPNAVVDGTFDVTENVLVADLKLDDQLVVAGAESVFRIDHLAVTAHFHGASVPQAWAR
jgi:hypothetical protein